MNTFFGFSRLQGAVFVAIAIAIFVGFAPKPANAQVASSITPVYNTQKDPCYGGMAINNIDVPFCAAERAGINFDNLKVVSSVDVPPIKDRWLSSWVPVNDDDGVRICVAFAVAEMFYYEIPSALRAAFVSIKPATGRVCWKFQ